ERCGAGGARLSVYIRRSLVDAEWAAVDDAFGETGREIGEQLAAIVVETHSCADDDLVVKFSGTPGEADAGSESPLTSGERRVADAFGGEQLVVAGDDEAVEASAAGIDGVGS